MINLMLDLESASLRKNAAIVQIGAVAVDDDLSMCVDDYLNLNIDPMQYDGPFRGKFDIQLETTMDFWAEQAGDTRRGVWKFGEREETGAFILPAALLRFASYVRSFRHGAIGQNQEIRLWANHSSFDHCILAHAYDVCGLQVPWTYREEMDYATYKRVREDIELPDKPELGLHDALDDAIYQGQCLTRLLSADVRS